MGDAEILARITEVVRDELDDDGIQLTMDTIAKQVDGWDSLAHVRIVVAVERAFGAHFDTRDITALENVGDLVRLCHQHASVGSVG